MLVLGLMSGTSLDGLDMALCEFESLNKSYRFNILQAKTIVYSEEWKNKLKTAQRLQAEDYFALHAAYGKYCAEKINVFLKEGQILPALIGSHGHTVFHQPQHGFSTQIGCGATITAHTKICTVSDFRSLDVALGGQGAPLVPIGDQLLFSNYQACLNLGGFANISFGDEKGKRIAYDICELNLLLNGLSEKLGKSYDDGGNFARAGEVNQDLFQKLNKQEFYQQKGAKSLGREWLEKNSLAIVNSSDLTAEDLLATSTEHIAEIIAGDLNHHKIKSVLVTGGGVYNDFLMEKIKQKTKAQLVVPEDKIIQFKEALIFAFLAYLRLHQKVNTLQSVTGALQDSIGGALHQA